ncbi:hypothetical protein [Rhizobium ruizarguesonis]|uniref:hypothetical protein n=1 Tax=Rhizobium ruizarguesonis TaxID=2081791 RepID=UPI000412B5E8|nr:hypothetical protein [Rhizobium ruizarguesonis]QJS27459.1 hypothetical protein RLTA1_09250 [Rhizobium leguminosarum bv. trifolii TA1]UFW96213.1 hypothetical protein RlegTA1_09215 [Rhizobium ruizarguesonis]
MPQVRVNVRSLANVKAVRKEKRNGRDVVIVPSATLPDDIIMNGIKYPSEEIEKSYLTLNRSPAPLGHPLVNGKFISARDPEGVNIGHIGAWNENVRREGGRVLLDKVIDVEVANRTEGGKAVLAAIEAGGPVHTSTGLLATMEAVNAADHKRIARNMVFDHDAILIGEEGAATPDQGVGMLVNAKGEMEDIEVVNSALTDAADQEIDWAGTRLVEALMRRKNVGLWEKTKTAMMEALGFNERESSTNTKEDEMPVTDEQFKSLSDEVKALSGSMAKIGETIANSVTAALKPVLDAQAEMVANQKAKDDAEHATLVTKVVNAKLLDEATAKATPLATLRALAPSPQAEKKPAAALNSAFKGSEQSSGFKLPKGDK